MLLCPSCTDTLEKNEKHGEGVWQCPNKDCGMVWFIVAIPRPKYLMNKKEAKIENGLEQPEEKAK